MTTRWQSWHAAFEEADKEPSRAIRLEVSVNDFAAALGELMTTRVLLMSPEQHQAASREGFLQWWDARGRCVDLVREGGPAARRPFTMLDIPARTFAGLDRPVGAMPLAPSLIEGYVVTAADEAAGLSALAIELREQERAARGEPSAVRTGAQWTPEQLAKAKVELRDASALYPAPRFVAPNPPKGKKK